MDNILRPGAGLLYMKIGTHAQEPLEEILARKAREIADAGFALWGYGGGTCHPLSMVQPFAREYRRQGSVIYLCMEPMQSKHVAPQERARQFSVDGVQWEDIPGPINVLGSRYALAIRDLHADTFQLPLSHTKVALGNSAGRSGNRYVTGRVDKACLRVVGDDEAGEGDDEPKPIGWVAELVEPYAVFVRN